MYLNFSNGTSALATCTRLVTSGTVLRILYMTSKNSARSRMDGNRHRVSMSASDCQRKREIGLKQVCAFGHPEKKKSLTLGMDANGIAAIRTHNGIDAIWLGNTLPHTQ